MSNKWWVLSAVACGTFMATVDASIVNLALPTLNREFNVPINLSKWVVVAYFMVITCLLLPVGQWSDRIGRRRVILWGFGLFTLASLYCSVSVSLWGLVCGRVAQGLGSAMLMANGPAIITQFFVQRDRGFALGILAMVVSTGLLAGPALGGPMISSFGWRSIFLVNIPFGLFGLLLGNRFIPYDLDRESSSRLRYDWMGALLQIFIVIGIIEASDFRNGIPVPWRLALAGALAAALVAFVVLEQRVPQPLFDLKLLHNRIFWTGTLSSFLLFFAYSSFSVLFPYFLEDALSFSPKRTGLFLSAIPLTILFVAPWAGRISDRLGSLELCTAGSALMSLTLLLLASRPSDSISVWGQAKPLLFMLILLGLALGLFQSPNNNAVMGAVPKNKLGTASAFLATIRNLGLVVGAHFSTGYFSWQISRSQNFVTALQSTWWIAGFVAFGAFVAVLSSHRKRREAA